SSRAVRAAAGACASNAAALFVPCHRVLRSDGTVGGFRERAWRVLRHVPPGEPVTYAGFARMLGSSRAVRAAAGACASNAAALFVPCHRVLRSDGTVGGFRSSRAVRAAAGACASNAAALFVPCHRVLRSDGTVGGFRYGTPVKQSLLDREAGAR
ncbi:methylated-DNA--[protein]-cysteine S-methyltransferase, partial [Corynebacterium bovis]|uniref:methylated-DNA--[protein]-cysteine S-methyltransferase n=1 Tax=Corynebacterium bovis TaxID=36808 RepID=UPI00313A3155